MYAEERQGAILEIARAEGRVDNLDLAKRLSVTPETIRRDLSALARHGVLRRAHGGAIPVERLPIETAVVERSLVRRDEKARIARRAADELPADGAIVLDSGTTTAALAELLPVSGRLTVITNSLSIGLALSSRPNITVLTLGGRVRARTFATVDAWALNALEQMFVDVAFVGANGISTERGLTTPDLAEATVKRTMMRQSRRTVVLADRSKFEADHLTQFGQLSDVDLIVTDDGLDPSIADAVRVAGPRVELA